MPENAVVSDGVAGDGQVSDLQLGSLEIKQIDEENILLEDSQENLPTSGAQSLPLPQSPSKSKSFVSMHALIKKASVESMRSPAGGGSSAAGDPATDGMEGNKGLVSVQGSFVKLHSSAMEKKHSAVDLGIKSGSSFILAKGPTVNTELQPSTPVPPRTTRGSNSGFQLLLTGATELRRQADADSGVEWAEYQAVNNGPVFYVQLEIGKGQWARPAVFSTPTGKPLQLMCSESVL